MWYEQNDVLRGHTGINLKSQKTSLQHIPYKKEEKTWANFHETLIQTFSNVEIIWLDSTANNKTTAVLKTVLDLTDPSVICTWKGHTGVIRILRSQKIWTNIVCLDKMSVIGKRWVPLLLRNNIRVTKKKCDFGGLNE